MYLNIGRGGISRKLSLMLRTVLQLTLMEGSVCSFFCFCYVVSMEHLPCAVPFSLLRAPVLKVMPPQNVPSPPPLASKLLMFLKSVSVPLFIKEPFWKSCLKLDFCPQKNFRNILFIFPLVSCMKTICHL